MNGLATAASRRVVAGLVLAALPMAAAAQTPGDSAAVRARIEAYRAVWDTHDATALAGLFTEDAEFVMGNQPAAHGRTAIRDWWQAYFARQEPERTLSLDVSPVRFPAPGVAVVDVGTTTGGTDGQGRPLNARTFRGGWVMRRGSADWLIAAMVGLPTLEDSVALADSGQAAAALRPGIRGFVAAYSDAWNRRDPAAVAALYSEDAELAVRTSPVIRGRPAIRDFWTAYFAEPRPYRAVFDVDRILPIGPDAALVSLTITGAALPGNAGRRLPLRYTRGRWLVIREAGAWRLSAMWVLPSLDDDIIRRSGG